MENERNGYVIKLETINISFEKLAL